MFSGALMEVLRNGEISDQPAFSLTDVGLRVKDILRSRYPDEWIRPEVHSPDMREGNIADLPLFPNPRFSADLASISKIGKAGWPSMDEYVGKLESLLEARTEELRKAMGTLERSYDITLEALGDAIDLKDAETEGHAKRVTAFTIAVARAMGINRKEIAVIARGAFLHDIGNMAIPDIILRKPGALTPNEVLVMREHCERGYQMLRKIPFLSVAAEIVQSHQERYDGTGYPRGLKGDEIPLGARVFSVADTLDAITRDRPYRPSRTIAAAREEIQKSSGLQFDPQIVKTFLSMPVNIWSDLARDIETTRFKYTPTKKIDQGSDKPPSII
jgi:putative nucleotidyltransferase with HDIG domain